jgi:hypothetical protein
MSRSISSTLACCLLVVLLAPASLLAGSKPKKRKLTGRVIAKEFPLALVKLNEEYSVEYLLVRLDQHGSKRSMHGFAVIQYAHFDPDTELPADLMDGTAQWVFTGNPDRSCELTVRPGSIFEFESGATTLPDSGFALVKDHGEGLPLLGSKIPCYSVDPSGLKRVGVKANARTRKKRN